MNPSSMACRIEYWWKGWGWPLASRWPKTSMVLYFRRGGEGEEAEVGLLLAAFDDADNLLFVIGQLLFFVRAGVRWRECVRRRARLSSSRRSRPTASCALRRR